MVSNEPLESCVPSTTQILPENLEKNLVF
ncbi:hypothetical protein AX774_g6625, partial [Zancudomyces culisetae]